MRYMKGDNTAVKMDNNDAVKNDVADGILIVDDSRFAVKILKDILLKENYNVVAEARNGIEAIEYAKEFKPAYVFLDVEMPVLDGVNALPKILEANSGCYVIMCTAMGQQDIIEKSIKAGARDYVLKPYKRENIIGVMNVAVTVNSEKRIVPFKKANSKNHDDVLETVDAEEIGIGIAEANREETVKELKTGRKSKTANESKELEPVVELKARAELEPAVELKAVDKLEPVTELKAIGELEPVTELKSMGELEPVDELKAVGELEPVGELKTVGEPEAIKDVKAVGELEILEEAKGVGETEIIKDAKKVARYPESLENIKATEEAVIIGNAEAVENPAVVGAAIVLDEPETIKEVVIESSEVNIEKIETDIKNKEEAVAVELNEVLDEADAKKNNEVDDNQAENLVAEVNQEVLAVTEDKEDNKLFENEETFEQQMVRFNLELEELLKQQITLEIPPVKEELVVNSELDKAETLEVQEEAETSIQCEEKPTEVKEESFTEEIIAEEIVVEKPVAEEIVAEKSVAEEAVAEKTVAAEIVAEEILAENKVDNSEIVLKKELLEVNSSEKLEVGAENLDTNQTKVALDTNQKVKISAYDLLQQTESKIQAHDIAGWQSYGYLWDNRFMYCSMKSSQPGVHNRVSFMKISSYGNQLLNIRSTENDILIALVQSYYLDCRFSNSVKLNQMFAQRDNKRIQRFVDRSMIEKIKSREIVMSDSLNWNFDKEEEHIETGFSNALMELFYSKELKL